MKRAAVGKTIPCAPLNYRSKPVTNEFKRFIVTEAFSILKFFKTKNGG